MLTKEIEAEDEYLDSCYEIVCVVCGVTNDWANVCMDCVNNENHDH